jgi:hypothetical protein
VLWTGLAIDEPGPTKNFNRWWVVAALSWLFDDRQPPNIADDTPEHVRLALSPARAHLVGASVAIALPALVMAAALWLLARRRRG